jgi:uncharacterized protein (DUF488 family)
MSDLTIYTVGHSNVSAEAFVALLRQHGITAVADVRSHPYSRYLPHFSQPALKATLREAGLHYVFLGRELGARPDDASCYVNGRAVYARIAATPLFARGLERVRQGAATERIALLCAEKDPITCHRTILVCRHLRDPELAIRHILADGTLEEHGALEQRLLRLRGLDQLDLFNPRPLDQLIEEAYDRQGEEIAYIREDGDSDDQLAGGD